MKKLFNNKGETLIETLSAMIVATLVVLFLAVSINSATRINKTVEETDTSFNYPTDPSAKREDVTVTIENEDGTWSKTETVDGYTDDTGYYHYYKESGN